MAEESFSAGHPKYSRVIQNGCKSWNIPLIHIDLDQYCREGIAWFGDTEGNCYRSIAVSSSEELRTACSSVGAPLAVINTATADSFLRNNRDYAYGIFLTWNSWWLLGKYPCEHLISCLKVYKLYSLIWKGDSNGQIILIFMLGI